MRMIFSRLTLAALSLLLCGCNAGPLIVVIAEVLDVVAGNAIMEGFVAGRVAATFGVGACRSFPLGDAAIADPALFYGTTAVGVGVLGGGVAGGVGGSAVAEKAKYESEQAAKASKSSVSVASVSSVSSWSSYKSAWSASKSSLTSQLSASETQARQSVLSEAAAIESLALATTRTYLNPFDFNTILTHVPKSKRAEVATTGTIPPAPPGFPTDQALPAGVPLYNLRMCQTDIVALNKTNTALTFDSPKPKAIRVGHIPPTCMVLAAVLLPHPELGPHPYATGSDSLEWDGVQDDTMDLIRMGFGLPFLNGTSVFTKAASASGK